MEPVANSLGSLMARMQEVASEGGTCAACGQAFHYLPETGGRCTNCERIWSDGKAILESLDAHVLQLLTRAGLSARELRAELREIPDAITTRLPQEAVRSMFRGETPTHAFGLIGAPGIGKTFALAAIFKAMTRNRIAGRAAREGSDALRDWLYWLPWPETVDRIRVLSMRDGGIRDVQAIVDAAIEAEALILDDVGSERLRGDIRDDPAAYKLALIVDGRHRAERPTWFTTNWGQTELNDRYGQRLVRRLFDVTTVVLPRANSQERIQP